MSSKHKGLIRCIYRFMMSIIEQQCRTKTLDLRNAQSTAVCCKIDRSTPLSLALILSPQSLPFSNTIIRHLFIQQAPFSFGFLCLSKCGQCYLVDKIALANCFNVTNLSMKCDHLLFKSQNLPVGSSIASSFVCESLHCEQEIQFF